MSGVSKRKKNPETPRNDLLGELDSLDRELTAVDVGDDIRDQISKLERNYTVVQSLLDISASITSTLDLTDLLEHIIDSILKLTGCQRGFLMLMNEDGGLSLEIARVTGQNQWKEDELEISKSVVREVAETAQPVFNSNVFEMEGIQVSESIHLLKINSVICLPLEFEGKMVGVIYADSKSVSEAFLDSDLKVMNAFAGQAAIAINNARQHGELKIQREKLEEQNLSLRYKLGEEFASYGMISNDAKMEELFERINKIAPSDINVIIRGESGTGKELLARAIHDKSSRAKERFEPINCTAIPAGLVESTFFGHKRGAFTGAVENRQGVFELAHRGTIFLDEIGDMPLEVQPKILRVIQDGKVSRVGEPDIVRKVDVRILTATHVDLARAVKEGRFRQDLYFRLKVAQVELPPLRERRGDIIPLAEYFLKKYADEKNQPLPKLHKNTKEFLLQNRWEGNIRTLKSAIDYAIVFQDDKHWILVDALEKFFSQEGEPIMDNAAGSLKQKLQQYESRIIRQTLDKHSWNVTVTAKALAISRQQLHNKIKKFDLSGRSE
jgi:transcriptional regulator with GAF, ATPase, and Fis domain